MGIKKEQGIGIGIVAGLISSLGVAKLISKEKKVKHKEADIITMYQELENYQILYVNNEPTIRVKKKKVKKPMDIKLKDIEVIRGEKLPYPTIYYKYDQNNKEIVSDVTFIIHEHDLEGFRVGYKRAFGKEIAVEENREIEDVVQKFIRGVKKSIEG